MRRLFGRGFLAANGAVDRVKLAQHVFSDAEARRKLESVIHPLVGERFQGLSAAATGPVVFEVPLLAETGGRGSYEVVVTVEAETELRLQRAIARGLKREDAMARIAAQASTEERTSLANFVIVNDGTMAELESKAARVAECLERLSAERPASD